MKIVRIEPHQLGVVADRLEEGLDDVERHAPQTWTRADVYAALVNGSATLYLGFEDGEYRGFVILFPERHADCLHLVVWVIYGRGAFEQMPWLLDRAREIGASHIAFCTRRPGFSRIAERLGFEYVHTVYRMPCHGR